MTLKHFVTWEVSIKELREIVEQLRENSVLSLAIGEDVELIIKRKKTVKELKP